jgi:hypothetical protein
MARRYLGETHGVRRAFLLAKEPQNPKERIENGVQESAEFQERTT